jgi:hypothetical protein
MWGVLPCSRAVNRPGTSRERTGDVAMRYLLLAASAILLSGCVPSEVFVMQNPKTGEIVQCKTESHNSLFPIVQGLQDNAGAEHCAAGYKAAGWRQMNQ